MRKAKVYNIARLKRDVRTERQVQRFIGGIIGGATTMSSAFVLGFAIRNMIDDGINEPTVLVAAMGAIGVAGGVTLLKQTFKLNKLLRRSKSQD
jgi:hypothetical protein